MKSAKRGSNMTHGWDDAHKHLEPMSCDRSLNVLAMTEKVRCEVYCLHRTCLEIAALPRRFTSSNNCFDECGSASLYPEQHGPPHRLLYLC